MNDSNTSIGSDEPGQADVSPLGDGPDPDNETGSVESDEPGGDVTREDIEREGTRQDDRNTSADQSSRSGKTNKIHDDAIRIN